jgi:hypothetical protein
MPKKGVEGSRMKNTQLWESIEGYGLLESSRILRNDSLGVIEAMQFVVYKLAVD